MVRLELIGFQSVDVVAIGASSGSADKGLKCAGGEMWRRRIFSE